MRQQGNRELHGRYSIIRGPVSDIVEHFSRIVRDDPNRPLIVVPSREESLTADQIWRRCHEIVRAFNAFGLSAGDLLLCAIGNRAEFVPVLLACCVLDLTLMAADSGATPVEVKAICAH